MYYLTSRGHSEQFFSLGSTLYTTCSGRKRIRIRRRCPRKGDPLNKGIERPECTGGSSFIAMSGQCRAVSNDRPIEKYLSAPASVRSTVSSTVYTNKQVQTVVTPHRIRRIHSCNFILSPKKGPNNILHSSTNHSSKTPPPSDKIH